MRLCLSICVAMAVTALGAASAQAATLLNASYDVARDFYRDFNPAFEEHWKALGKGEVTIDQSHGGSSKQARAVIDGLAADVVTMNSPLDIDVIAKAGLLSSDWARRLPDDSSPSWSAILFVVRKGNPKNIHDWSDLLRPGIEVVIPNPKTSGNGRYSYLAAWQYAKTHAAICKCEPLQFEKALFTNVPVLDSGGRGATTSFAQRGVGDVLLTFENEIFEIRKEFAAEQFQVVAPALTIRANNPVAWVDTVTGRNGTTALAQEYLKFHYSEAGQELFASHGIRPVDETVLQRHSADFPPLTLFTVEAAFGSWAQAYATHFADGGSFDQVMAVVHGH